MRIAGAPLLADHRVLPGEMSTKIHRISSMSGHHC
jgi:hypothetical protein